MLENVFYELFNFHEERVKQNEVNCMDCSADLTPAVHPAGHVVPVPGAVQLLLAVH